MNAGRPAAFAKICESVAGYRETGRVLVAEDRFARALKKHRQISVTVLGRRSGRTITLPVWFVFEEEALWLLPVYGSQTQWYRNLLVNSAITIQVRSERRKLEARVLREARAVRRVIRWFREKYTPEMIERLYSGPLNVAVEVRLQGNTIRAR